MFTAAFWWMFRYGITDDEDEKDSGMEKRKKKKQTKEQGATIAKGRDSVQLSPVWLLSCV